MYFKNKKNSFLTVKNLFGVKFVIMMMSTYIGLKGSLNLILHSIQLPISKELNISGTRYLVYQTVVMAPWSIKPVVGVLSDSVKLFGYHKRYYMALYGLCGLIGLFALYFIPLEITFQIANVDLLCEGKYAELMRNFPAASADLVSFIFSCQVFGHLIAACYVGVATDILGWRFVILTALFFSVQNVFFSSAGFLVEREYINDEINSSDFIRRKEPLMKYAYIISLCSVSLSLIGIINQPKFHYACALIFALFLCYLSFIKLDREVAMINIYAFLQDFWYTAGPECVPDGPHFDYTYYQTYTQIISSIGAVIGLMIHKKYLSKMRFRKIYVFSIIIRILASLFDIIIVTRLNRNYGISDKAMYMFGDGIIYHIIVMFNHIPNVMLISLFCTETLECTTYAILAGFANFGSNISRLNGAALMRVMNLSTEANKCLFDKLVYALVIGHIIGPLLLIPFIFILIPDIYPADPSYTKTNDTHSIEFIKKDEYN